MNDLDVSVVQDDPFEIIAQGVEAQLHAEFGVTSEIPAGATTMRYIGGLAFDVPFTMDFVLLHARNCVTGHQQNIPEAIRAISVTAENDYFLISMYNDRPIVAQ